MLFYYSCTPLHRAEMPFNFENHTRRWLNLSEMLEQVCSFVVIGAHIMYTGQEQVASLRVWRQQYSKWDSTWKFKDRNGPVREKVMLWRDREEEKEMREGEKED